MTGRQMWFTFLPCPLHLRKHALHCLVPLCSAMVVGSYFW